MSEETDQNSKSKKHYVQTVIEAVLLFFISLGLILMADIGRTHHGRRNSYQKLCFSNQRVLIGAIEMYNMDHNEMIKTYDNDYLDLLVRGKYLHSSFKNNFECELVTEGDLTENGFIYCVNHGSYDGQKKGKDELASLTPKSDRLRERNMDLFICGFLFGPTLLYLVLRLI